MVGHSKCTTECIGTLKGFPLCLYCDFMVVLQTPWSQCPCSCGELSFTFIYGSEWPMCDYNIIHERSDGDTKQL